MGPTPQFGTIDFHPSEVAGLPFGLFQIQVRLPFRHWVMLGSEDLVTQPGVEPGFLLRGCL